MTTLYLAWRHAGQRWWPVGRLTHEGGDYVFTYTKGALDAEQAGFRPLLTFPERDEVYISRELFPLFANRLLPKSRPEFDQFVEWLDLGPDQADPMALLARSGGHRETDMFEVFGPPEGSEGGQLRAAFPVHGLRHCSPAGQLRASSLQPGDALLAEPQPDNAADPRALRILTADGAHIGFVPRYLCEDFHRLAAASAERPRVTVRRVNPPPTPLQFRVLCAVEAQWPVGFRPLSGHEFEPLHELAGAGAQATRAATNRV